MKKTALLLAAILAAALAQVDVSPTITDPNQPADASVFLGQSPAFTVAVSSATPVGYQWRFNDQPLDGQTNQTLTLVGEGTNVIVNDSTLPRSKRFYRLLSNE